MCRVTYLEHSGFFLELDACCILFDYWKGDIPDIAKPYYVFVSHAHVDHFNPVIFDLLKRSYRTHIIVTNDVHAPKHMDVHVVQAQEDITIDQLHIRTLASTDEGVAYLVQTKDTTIYHAGDLHWWHWEEESSVEEKEEMKQAYLQQLEQIKDVAIDIAFVVLDPRLDEQTNWGMDAFLDICSASYVFPMHFWGDFDAIERYKEHCLSKAKIMSLHHRQEEVQL